jgi:hypothetical protein
MDIKWSVYVYMRKEQEQRVETKENYPFDMVFTQTAPQHAFDHAHAQKLTEHKPADNFLLNTNTLDHRLD